MRINDILRSARIASGLSQVEVAERAGLRQPTISKYELGQRTPELPNLVRLAEIYGVELRFGEEMVRRE